MVKKVIFKTLLNEVIYKTINMENFTSLVNKF